MSKLKVGKRFASAVVGVATVVSMSGFLPAVVSADTTSDLIASLQAQIASLQAQIAALAGTPSSSTSACTFTRSLTVGVRGDDVKCLQESLISQGHLAAGLNTAYFGNLTKAAVAKWQAANGVAPAVGYFGPLSQAKYNSMGGVVVVPPPPPPPTTGGGPTTTPPPVVVAAGSLGVTAATQPANTLAPFNAVRVPFTKLVLTAGSSDVVVNGITIERTGLSADSNFSGVVLLDGNGSQLDIEKTFGSDHKAVVGGTFTVKAGTSASFTVAGNMAATVSGGQVASLTVVAINTTAAVSGTLPITGAEHTVNATLTIGDVTLARGSTDPGSSQSKEVGTTGYTFSSIRVTAGSAEKVYLKSMRWNQTGSAGSGDLGNVKTYVDGVAYDTSVSSDGKYYTARFMDNAGKGLLVDKGFSKDLAIKGDVVGGSGRSVDFDVAKRVDLDVVGETYGYGIKAPQTGTTDPTDDTAAFSNTEDPWYDAAQVTVSAGSMTVSSSNIVPAQNIAENTPNVPLGGFEVEVKGEAISVGSTLFHFETNNGTAGTAASGDAVDVDNVSLLKEDGTVLAGPVDAVLIGTTGGSVTFSSSITYPVGVTKLKLVGKVGTDFAVNDRISASSTPSTHWTTVRGQVTGNTITPNPTSAVTGQTMTIRGGAFTVTVSSNPIAQTIIAGTKGFTFANYTLDVGGSGEDVRLTSLPVEYNVTTGNGNDLSNCQLYDGATSLTTGSNVVNPTARGSSTNFVFDGTGLILAKGTQKSVALKCDVRTGSTGSYSMGIQNGVDYTGATGVSSGSTIVETFNDGVGQLMTAAANGSLTVAIDTGSAGSLSYRLVSPGQNVELIKIRYSATNEDINIKRVAMQLTGTGSNTPINLVNQEVTLWDGTTQVGSAVVDSTLDTATSTLSTAVKVPKGGSKIITVKGVIAGITSSGPMTRSADLLIVDYDGGNVGINGNYGTGAESGATISGTATDTTSNGVRIVKSYPEFANDALTSSERTLTAGDGKTLYKFKVTAKNGDVALAKLSFSVSSSTVTNTVTGGSTTTKFGLYAFTDSAYSTADSNFSGTNNPGGLVNAGFCFSNIGPSSASLAPLGGLGGGSALVEIYPATTGCNNGSTTLTIPSGESRWFKLTGSIGTIAPSGTSESIQVQLEGDAAAAHGATAMLQATQRSLGAVGDNGVEVASHNDLIWSPRSTSTAASLFDLDWTNGYGVVGLPSTNMTIETLSK